MGDCYRLSIDYNPEKRLKYIKVLQMHYIECC